MYSHHNLYIFYWLCNLCNFLSTLHFKDLYAEEATGTPLSFFKDLYAAEAAGTPLSFF